MSVAAPPVSPSLPHLSGPQLEFTPDFLSRVYVDEAEARLIKKTRVKVDESLGIYIVAEGNGRGFRARRAANHLAETLFEQLEAGGTIDVSGARAALDNTRDGFISRAERRIPRLNRKYWRTRKLGATAAFMKLQQGADDGVEAVYGSVGGGIIHANPNGTISPLSYRSVETTGRLIRRHRPLKYFDTKRDAYGNPDDAQKVNVMPVGPDDRFALLTHSALVANETIAPSGIKGRIARRFGRISLRRSDAQIAEPYQASLLTVDAQDAARSIHRGAGKKGAVVTVVMPDGPVKVAAAPAAPAVNAAPAQVTAPVTAPAAVVAPGPHGASAANVAPVTVVDPNRAASNNRAKLLAAVAGGLLLGGLIGAAVHKYGFSPDVNLPDWFAGDPDMAAELHQAGYDLPEASVIMENRDVYDQLVDAKLEQPTIERIFENFELYTRLTEADLNMGQLEAIFADQKVVEALRAVSITEVETYKNLLQELTVFKALLESGLEPEAAIEFISYPDLVKAWKDSGMDDHVVQAVFDHPGEFSGLAEFNTPYDVVRQAMLESDPAQSIVDDLRDNASDIQGGGDANGTDGGSGGGSGDGANETAASGNTVYVDPSHGFTHEIDDFLDTLGVEWDDHRLRHFHELLTSEFGREYIQGIPLYPLPERVGGDYGFAHSGNGHWVAGVQEFIRAAVAQNWQPGQTVRV